MRTRALVGIGMISAAILGLPLPVCAQDSSDGPIAVTNPVLAASIGRLSAESRSWREAVGAVAGTGRRTIVVTPDQVNAPVESGTLAQVYPVADDYGRVNTVLVVVNLQLIQKLSGLPVKAVDFEDDLDRILAHEVYGHALPYLFVGNVSGKCADPTVGQSALTSCAVQRENVIRREMRLGQRSEYGRESLALARRNYRN